METLAKAFANTFILIWRLEPPVKV